MTTNQARILSYLHDQHDAMIAFVKRLVLAESPSSDAAAQAVPQALLWEALDGLDYSVTLTPGQKTGGHLVARPKIDTPHNQLLIGHCDTVWPLGTLKKMPVDQGDNTMTGPGIYDMKAGLTQMLFALKALRALGLQPTVAPLVMINSDEEIGSIESFNTIERLAQQANRAFILEPALGPSGKLKTGRKGVGRYTVVVRGKAAHAGLDPEKGVSAIWGMATVIDELFALNDLPNGLTVNVGVVEGGLSSNVIAPESVAYIDVRAPTVAGAEKLDDAILSIRSRVPGTSVEVVGKIGRLPLERTPANQRLWQRARQAGRALGITLHEGFAGGGSDGNITSQYTATLDGLGAVGDGAHADHEFIFLDKMIERSALLALLLLEPPLQQSA